MMKYLYRCLLFSILALVGAVLYFEISDRYNNYAEEKSVLANDDTKEDLAYSSKNSNPMIKQDNTDYVNYSENSLHMVIPSGEPIGIYVKTEGVMVIGTTSFKNSKGIDVSPCEGILTQGDYIISVNGEFIEDKNHLIEVIHNSRGKSLRVGIIRGNDRMFVDVKPEKSQGVYMLGLWVKDDISGIGTLTYIDENGFGALGHSINDNDTGEVFTISDGAIYETNLVNIVKPTEKEPGRLEGMIDYSKENIMGRVVENCKYGIKGYMTKKGVEELAYGEWIPVATKEESHLGEAYILSCVSGEPVYYKIKINDIDISESAGNKGLEIEITDERLLSITNGIVQGMSGTPIIQDGKLLGAITHVFVKDSTKGYGTFLEDMME